MTTEEGEKNFPCDEEPFPDDENKTEGCVRCRLGGVYTAFAVMG